MENTIKQGSVILVSIPKLKLPIAKVTVKAITQLPGKTLGIELPAPLSNHDCDGFCKERHGYWITPDQIIHAKSEEEAKRMLEEASRLAEAQKPKQMQLVIKDGGYKLAELAKA